MIESVLQFFGLLGLDISEAVTVPQFFVWLLQSLFSFGIVWFILSMFRRFGIAIFSAGKKL